MNYAWMKYCSPGTAVFLRDIVGCRDKSKSHLSCSIQGQFTGLWVNQDHTRIAQGKRKEFVVSGGQQQLAGKVCSLLIGNIAQLAVNFNCSQSDLRSTHSLTNVNYISGKQLGSGTYPHHSRKVQVQRLSSKQGPLGHFVAKGKGTLA